MAYNTRSDGSVYFTSPFGGSIVEVSGPIPTKTLPGPNREMPLPAPPPPPSNPVAAPPTIPPPPAPVLPRFVPMSNVNKNFKVAPSDIIQFNDDAVSIALIQQLLFEDIGAVELANISRSDLIDGQPAVYTPIANLSTLNREFNPNNMIATSNNLDYFSRFGLDISSRGINEPYFNDNGDLVIEIDTVYDGEEIQVEILTNGTINLVGDV
jgi:hypothetical protein